MPVSAENRTSLLSSDPQERYDDPLLDSLLALCRYHQKPASRAILVSGLPLIEQRLTIDLLPRAAARAGLRGRWLRRKLRDMPELALPAVLLLKGGRSALLLGWDDKERARLMLSESMGGEISVSVERLERDYSGMAFFAQPQHSQEIGRDPLVPRAKHWFKDTLNRSRWLYADAIVASVLINLIGLITPLFVMNVYDRVVPNQATSTLWVLAIGVAGAFLFELLLKSLRSLCLDLAGKKTDLIISATLFERIVGMLMRCRPARIGSFAQTIHEFQSLRDFLASLTLASLIDLPFVMLIVLVVGFLGGYLAWVPVLTFAIVLLVSWLLQRPLADTLHQTMKLSSERQSGLIETLGGLDAVKVYNAEGERQRLWEQTIGALGTLEMRAKMLSSLATNITMLLQQIAGVVMIVLGVYKIIDGDLSMGGLVACYMLSGRALGPLAQVSGLMTRYQHARATITSINDMMALPQERHPGERPLQRQSLRGAIEFRQVEFRYPDQQQPALKGINVSIAPGEKVGIIGRSGSGKSSLARLIVGLHQPDSGGLLIDGIDVRQLDVSDLRYNIGYVPQDIQLFSGTLRDNLMMGARYVEDDLVLHAAELAGVHEFARLHPQGYEMPVGERGSNLSGGQRQNVALARALLLDPPILLLDEPTSSVDNAGEERLKRRIAALSTNKTLLLVTHRTSMLSLVDRLIVLDRGQVIADGSRESVMDALKKRQIRVS